MTRIFAIGLLLAYSLRTDFGRVAYPQLDVQFCRKSLKPACVSTGFHAHPHLDSLCRQIAIKLLRFLAMWQSLLLELTAVGVQKCYLLEARVIIASYNHHVRLLSPGLGWFAPPKSTRRWEPTLSWNQLHQLRTGAGVVSEIADFNNWISTIGKAEITRSPTAMTL